MEFNNEIHINIIGSNNRNSQSCSHFKTKKMWFVTLSVFLIFSNSFHQVYTKPEVNRVQDEELHANKTLSRPKRVVSLAFILTTLAISNAGKCSEIYGCWKGYCWTYCGLSLSRGDWCYTTKTYSQSFDYVECSADSDCDPCWKCAGSCTV